MESGANPCLRDGGFPSLTPRGRQGGGLADVSLYNGSNPIHQRSTLWPVLSNASLLNTIRQDVGVPADEI